MRTDAFSLWSWGRLAVLLLASACATGCASEGTAPTDADAGPVAFASGEVTSAGGEVEIPDRARVEVPAGALSEPVHIRIDELERSRVAAAPDRTRMESAPFVLTPHGTSFEAPVRVAIRVPEVEGRARVYRLDDTLDPSWTLVGEEYGRAREIVVRVRSFSVYAVFVAETPGDCTALDDDGDSVGDFCDLCDLGDDNVDADMNGVADACPLLPLERINRTSAGGEILDGFSDGVAISGDGRFIAFGSSSDSVVAGDGNMEADVFRHDRITGETVLVSVNLAGTGSGDGSSQMPGISRDGRYVTFDSRASDLVAGDTNATRDIFIRDVLDGITTRVSVDSAGMEGNSGAIGVSATSADGRFVVFSSQSTNLVAGDINAQQDIFVRDLLMGTTDRVSVSGAGAEGDGHCVSPYISPDGRFVVFSSQSTNLVAGDTNAAADLFVRDRMMGTTAMASIPEGGGLANADTNQPSSWTPVISDDGRFVVFESGATNLVASDTNSASDVFVRDMMASTTTRVSIDSMGVEGNATSGTVSISSDGEAVSFFTFATNLDGAMATGLFVHHRASAATVRFSDATGLAVLSADGNYAALQTSDSLTIPGDPDTNDSSDIFVAPAR